MQTLHGLALYLDSCIISRSLIPRLGTKFSQLCRYQVILEYSEIKIKHFFLSVGQKNDIALLKSGLFPFSVT